MGECARFDVCPTRRALSDLGVSFPWIDHYCHSGHHETCVRLARLSAGMQVPIEMIPDGSAIDGELALRMRDWVN